MEPDDINYDVIDAIGIRVFLNEDYPVVCETLERIGIVNRREKIVFPSCYCLRTSIDLDDSPVYTVAHFKEMFALQNKRSEPSENDLARLRTITYFLDKWGLVEVINYDDIQEILQEKISVIPFREKSDYRIVHKFKSNKDLFS